MNGNLIRVNCKAHGQMCVDKYCIFYLSHRARGLSMSKIAQLFNDNTMLNDAKVSQFVKNRFKVLSKQPFVGLNQFSKKMIEK